MKKLAVIAFGGNALLRGDQEGTFAEQTQNVKDTCSHVLEIIKKDYNLVIGHGNGPQVGNVLLQHDAGSKNYNIPAQPMDFCVAETQGSIAYLIEQEMLNNLMEAEINRDVVSLITRVVVDKNDEAFVKLAKPVGPYYTEDEAKQLGDSKKWTFAKDPRGRGMRRVVASPKPIDIINVELVERLAKEGKVVVTVGGGGIPVINDKGQYKGVEAVIDKDLASAMLASKIGADEFFILTDVSKISLNFNTPEQKDLDVMTVKQAEQYLTEGHFAEGSMAPKVRAALHFIENGGKEALITETTKLGDPSAGTRIIK